MDRAVGRILRSDEVKLEGRIQLNVADPRSTKGGPRAGARPQAWTGSDPTSSGSAAQQVRIVEDNPEFALIEVTCCCGEKTYLRCEYAGAGALEGAGSMEHKNE